MAKTKPTKTYKAILINPFNETVSIVYHPCTTKDIRDTLSQDNHSCADYESVGLSKRDAMMVDSEAGLTGRLPAFTFNGRLIYGKGLIIGHTPSGNPTFAKTDIGLVRSLVSFHDTGKAKMWALTDGDNVHNNPAVEAMDHSPVIVEISEAEFMARMKSR